MRASLKCSASAIRTSVASRRFSLCVDFQLTMNPPRPAFFASSIWRRITFGSPLEYLPSDGYVVFARLHDACWYQM